MKEFIINYFINNEINEINSIFEYIKTHYDNSIEINNIKLEINKLIKNKIIICNNKHYNLTDEGNVILNDHIYYYARIIINFCKKYSNNYKKYELKEKRLEQQSLRLFLTKNREYTCIICDKHLPLCLLETAHIKPRCLLSYNEKMDNNIVEFMCRYCHNLYDNGYLGINNGFLCVSAFLDNSYDLEYNKNKLIKTYNANNYKYFDFHYKFIYKN